MTTAPAFIAAAPLRVAPSHAPSTSARRAPRAAVSSPPPVPTPPQRSGGAARNPSSRNPSSRPYTHAPPPRRAAPPPPPEPAHVTSPGELATLLSTTERSLVILKVYSRRCRSCMAVRRPFARTAVQQGERAAFVQFCAEDNVEMAKSLGLRSFPTFIVYQRGKRVDHFAGISMRPVLQALDDYE